MVVSHLTIKEMMKVEQIQQRMELLDHVFLPERGALGILLSL